MALDFSAPFVSTSRRPLRALTRTTHRVCQAVLVVRVKALGRQQPTRPCRVEFTPASPNPICVRILAELCINLEPPPHLFSPGTPVSIFSLFSAGSALSTSSTAVTTASTFSSTFFSSMCLSSLVQYVWSVEAAMVRGQNLHTKSAPPLPARRSEQRTTHHRTEA